MNALHLINIVPLFWLSSEASALLDPLLIFLGQGGVSVDVKVMRETEPALRILEIL
jgi:hypothetical protein